MDPYRFNGTLLVHRYMLRDLAVNKKKENGNSGKNCIRNNTLFSFLNTYELTDSINNSEMSVNNICKSFELVLLNASYSS